METLLPTPRFAHYRYQILEYFGLRRRDWKLYRRSRRSFCGLIRGDANDVDTRITGDSDVNINYIDVRYAGFKPWAGSWTEVGIDYAMPNPTKQQKEYGGLYDADNAVMLTGEISQDMFGGYNKLVLQYANKGLAQNMISQGGGWYDMWHKTDEAKGYRVINTGLILLPINSLSTMCWLGVRLTILLNTPIKPIWFLW